MDLPLKGLCINGYNEKLEITIDEVFGFPNETCIEGGYAVKGTLNIIVGCYSLHCNNYYFSTGALYNLLKSLLLCYKACEGSAEYKLLLENDLCFKVLMGKYGHAVIEGSFQERADSRNILQFEIATDQTCILSAINDLKIIYQIFGDNTGKRTK